MATISACTPIFDSLSASHSTAASKGAMAADRSASILRVGGWRRRRRRSSPAESLCRSRWSALAQRRVRHGPARVCRRHAARLRLRRSPDRRRSPQRARALTIPHAAHVPNDAGRVSPRPHPHLRLTAQLRALRRQPCAELHRGKSDAMIRRSVVLGWEALQKEYRYLFNASLPAPVPGS